MKILILSAFVLGVLAGFYFGKGFSLLNKPIGYIRVYRLEKDEPPTLLLEIVKGGARFLQDGKTIKLKVTESKFLPRE